MICKQLVQRRFVELFNPSFQVEKLKPACVWRWDFVTISASSVPVFLSSLSLFVLTAGFANPVFHFPFLRLFPHPALCDLDTLINLSSLCNRFQCRHFTAAPLSSSFVHCHRPNSHSASIRKRVRVGERESERAKETHTQETSRKDRVSETAAKTSRTHFSLSGRHPMGLCLCSGQL